MRFEADLELTLALNPQLVSISDGYDSVQATVRELKTKGFYDFYEELPFLPIVIDGQVDVL